MIRFLAIRLIRDSKFYLVSNSTPFFRLIRSRQGVHTRRRPLWFATMNEWCNLKLCLWIYYSSVLRKLRRNLKKVNQYVCLSTAKTSLKSSPPPFFRPNVFGICDLNLLEARAKIGHITSYNIAVFWSREKPCSIRLLGVFAVSCDRYDLGHNLRIQNNRRLVSTARTFGIDRLYADRSHVIAFM